MTIAERFWPKVNRNGPGGCWLWIACTDQDGYGFFWDGVRQVHAHRFAYGFLVGPIPDGLQIDHLCRVRSCVNPEHLEPVTCRTNILRGEGTAAQRARQTHCHLGHELSGENLYRRSNGRRECRKCRLEAARRHRARLKAA